MAKKSKKQLVFALFAEGKRPQHQELKDLGIKSHTLCNYHQLFKNNGSTSEDHPQSSTSVNPTEVVPRGSTSEVVPRVTSRSSPSATPVGPRSVRAIPALTWPTKELFQNGDGDAQIES